MSNSFTTYEGKFVCKTCKQEVSSIRIYLDTGTGTWMCKEKHISEAQVYQVGYKNKRGHERKE
jgi:hypothetical protein